MPRTLAQNAQYIAETIKPAIKSAIEAQGVTVPSTDSFLDYADRIGEIEGGGSGYQLKDLPTGTIATVNDAAELPLNALKVSVEAWQEGSGDPSPSNIRPIHGWSSGKIGVVGKNWLKGLTYLYNSKNLFIGGDNSSNVEYYLKKGTYALSILYKSGVFYNNKQINYAKRDGSPVVFPAGQTVAIITLNEDGWYRFWINTAGSISPSDIDYFWLELGSTATEYEPYQGKQYTQQFPQTIYGAEWDVVNGELKQTDGYIASYNGETFPSTWISDRDVYASGTTPTIGAEVVYKLATPTTIDISPLSIRLLQGVNNIYADCGEVIEGEYFVGETKAYDLVEYIESDGTQVIDLGRQVVQGQTVKTVFHPMANQVAYAWLFGSGDVSHYYGFQFPQQTNLLEYNGSTSSSGQMSVNTADEYAYNLAFTASSSLALDYYVFGFHYSETPGGNNMGKFRLYSISINGDDYLPCKRRSDGKFGLYDVANSQFLTDMASGNAFVGGNSLGIRIG